MKKGLRILFKVATVTLAVVTLLLAVYIMINGLGLVDSFPIDVWMRRVMNRLYGFEESDTKGMAAFAGEKFAPYGGIAQQYLFYFITHKGVDNGGE